MSQIPQPDLSAGTSRLLLINTFFQLLRWQSAWTSQRESQREFYLPLSSPSMARSLSLLWTMNEPSLLSKTPSSDVSNSNQQWLIHLYNSNVSGSKAWPAYLKYHYRVNNFLFQIKVVDMKMTAKWTGLCNTTYTFFLFIISFCHIFFSLFLIPLEKKTKTIPRHYLLISHASKSISKQIITITTSFICKPLQPRCQDPQHTMVNQALLLHCLSSP